MALKMLSAFFDVLKFLVGKRLIVVSTKPWKDYETGRACGTKIELAIVEDNTVYPPKANGETVNGVNAYEKLVAKIPKNVTVEKGTEVTLINPTGKPYGTYLENLSLTADDIQVVKPTGKP